MEKIEIIDLVKYRNSLLYQLKEEIRKNEIASKDQLHTAGREIRIQRMRDLRAMIKQIDTTLKETGIFRTSEFADFLTKFYMLTEEGRKAKTTFRTTSPDGHAGASYYVVADPDTIDFLKKTIRTKKDLKKFMLAEPTDDITKMAGDIVYPFKENGRMKEKFRTHYRLKYAIYELMQLRIDHPEMTDKERYQRVLENTIKRNLGKTK